LSVLAGMPPTIRKSCGQFKRRRLADARSNYKRCGRRKFDALQNRNFRLVVLHTVDASHGWLNRRTELIGALK
jgi:hypothetical protein